MCAHNMGEKAVRTITGGQPGAVGAQGRERSLLSGESGKALWNRWLLSWASEKWIGFQQVEVGSGHTAILVGLAEGCVLKIWFNHLLLSLSPRGVLKADHFPRPVVSSLPPC